MARKGAGFAQSGGRNSSFGGGKGGGVWQGKGAASKTGVVGRNKTATGTNVNVRSPGGDSARAGGATRKGTVVNLPQGPVPKVGRGKPAPTRTTKMRKDYKGGTI